ncbi:MAG: hypothetical protein V4631_15370 [Pseudomonadota bacterium]
MIHQPFVAVDYRKGRSISLLSLATANDSVSFDTPVSMLSPCLGDARLSDSPFFMTDSASIETLPPALCGAFKFDAAWLSSRAPAPAGPAEATRLFPASAFFDLTRFIVFPFQWHFRNTINQAGCPTSEREVWWTCAPTPRNGVVASVAEHSQYAPPI